MLHRKLNQVAQAVVFDVQDGHVFMKGTVPSYYLKQLAQESALKINGVQSVMNQIRVEP
jgi:osmotically-inducible protein OsmY